MTAVETRAGTAPVEASRVTGADAVAAERAATDVAPDGSPTSGPHTCEIAKEKPAEQPAPRRPWRSWRWIVLAVAVAIGVAAAGYGADAVLGDDAATPALGPGEVTVQMDVEHSLFRPGEVRVVEGTRVRFVVVNGDPIGHELIVGPPDVHARHAEGMEAEHPSIPGEVSVGANRTAVTTFTFDTAGAFEFACHLPGHYEHGMHGTVEVVRGVP